MTTYIYKSPDNSDRFMVVLEGKTGGTYYWTEEQMHELAVRLAEWDTSRVTDDPENVNGSA